MKEMKTYICIVAVFVCFVGCIHADGNTNSLSTADLHDILSVVVATNSPMVNLAGNLSTNLQVSLPPCKGTPPSKAGRTNLTPFDDNVNGMRLSIRLTSHSTTRIVIRADVTFFDPTRGYANMGAEWQELVFQKKNQKWIFHKSLGGAIK
jgi:hypothetical protein